MRLRIGGNRATDHEIDGVGVGTTGLDVIRLDFMTRPDADNRGRPRHKVRIEITADDLAGTATSDPVLCAAVRHLVLMLEAKGIDWRANRYLEIDDPEAR